MAANPDPAFPRDVTEHATRHITSGRFESVSEVVQAGLEALDREEAAFDELVRAKIAEALADPRPPMPFDEAIARVWETVGRKRA